MLLALVLACCCSCCSCCCCYHHRYFLSLAFVCARGVLLVSTTARSTSASCHHQHSARLTKLGAAMFGNKRPPLQLLYELVPVQDEWSRPYSQQRDQPTRTCAKQHSCAYVPDASVYCLGFCCFCSPFSSVKVSESESQHKCQVRRARSSLSLDRPLSATSAAPKQPSEFSCNQNTLRWWSSAR